MSSPSSGGPGVLEHVEGIVRARARAVSFKLTRLRHAPAPGDAHMRLLAARAHAQGALDVLEWVARELDTLRRPLTVADPAKPAPLEPRPW